MQLTTASNAPIIGAKIYNQSPLIFPETIFGASERAGFIEALVMGPAKSASNRTTDPIAIPAIIPISLLPVETLIITTIRKNVRINSNTKARHTSTEGIVAPSSSLLGNNHINNKLAAKAPATWKNIYLGTSFQENFLA